MGSCVCHVLCIFDHWDQCPSFIRVSTSRAAISRFKITWTLLTVGKEKKTHYFAGGSCRQINEATTQIHCEHSHALSNLLDRSHKQMSSTQGFFSATVKIKHKNLLTDKQLYEIGPWLDHVQGFHKPCTTSCVGFISGSLYLELLSNNVNNDNSSQFKSGTFSHQVWTGLQMRPIHSTLEGFIRWCGAICSQPCLKHRSKALLLTMSVSGSSLHALHNTWDLRLNRAGIWHWTAGSRPVILASG